MSDSKFGDVVFAVQINSIDLEWHTDELAIENSAMGKCINGFATAHEKYLRTLNLNLKIRTIIHFKRIGTATIEFHVTPLKAGLDFGELDVEVVRSVIQKRFDRHLSQARKIVNSSSAEKIIDDLGGEYESVEALANCISRPIDMEVAYLLNNGAQIECVKITKTIVDDVACGDVSMEVVAEVACFHNRSGRVMLDRIRGIQGYVTLLVTDDSHRDALIDALKLGGQVCVKYRPFISQIRPDKHPREGIVISVGYDFTQMQLR